MGFHFIKWKKAFSFQQVVPIICMYEEPPPLFHILHKIQFEMDRKPKCKH